MRNALGITIWGNSLDQYITNGGEVNKKLPVSQCFTSKRAPRQNHSDAGRACLFVHNRVGKVDIFLIHFLFGQTYRFTEALEMDHLPLTQESDYIVYVRIVGQT